MSVLLLLAVVALDPMVQKVVDAMSTPDCPALFGMLTPQFQKAMPAEKWPVLCRRFAPITKVERVDDVDGWPNYRMHAGNGVWRLGLVLKDGLIAGLYARPWTDAETARSLDEKLAQVGARYKVPGISALVLRDGHVIQQAVWGVRKLGDATPIDKADRWHLGSDTKGMTATLAALLVQEGKLSWSSTIGAVLPEWKDIDPRFAAVTLEQLLSHRGGLPKDVPSSIWSKLWAAKDAERGRWDAVHALLKQPPGKVDDFEYANAGYMAAGVMLEKVTGQPWDTLLRARVFAPLGMASCGFGPPATSGAIDQPWAHRVRGDSFDPVSGPQADNPPGLGPAGTVHCSLPDWAKFVADHVHGERGEPTVLKLETATYRSLHVARGGGDYALGWGVAQPRWSAGPVLVHDGTNTMNYASVAAAPAENLILLVATNCGGEQAQRAVSEVMTYLASATRQATAK